MTGTLGGEIARRARSWIDRREGCARDLMRAAVNDNVQGSDHVEVHVEVNVHAERHWI